MKIEKKVLTEALRVLGKVVSQTAPEAVLRQVRFVGCGGRDGDGFRLNCKKKKAAKTAANFVFGGR